MGTSSGKLFSCSKNRVSEAIAHRHMQDSITGSSNCLAIMLRGFCSVHESHEPVQLIYIGKDNPLLRLSVVNLWFAV